MHYITSFSFNDVFDLPSKSNANQVRSSSRSVYATDVTKSHLKKIRFCSSILHSTLDPQHGFGNTYFLTELT